MWADVDLYAYVIMEPSNISCLVSSLQFSESCNLSETWVRLELLWGFQLGYYQQIPLELILILKMQADAAVVQIQNRRRAESFQ